MATQWDMRLAELDARASAERDYGDGELERANTAYEASYKRLVAIYGSVELARANPVGRKAFETAWNSTTAIESRHADLVDAHDKAIIALLLTPAPTLEAVLVKIDISLARGIDDLSSMPMPTMEALRHDIEAMLNREGA